MVAQQAAADIMVATAEMREEIAFQVDFERAAPRYRQLPEPVRRILRLCDGTRGLTQVVALSPIDAERTEAVLRRLAQLGIITPGQRATKAAGAKATPANSQAQQVAQAQSAKATQAQQVPKAQQSQSSKAAHAAQALKAGPAKSKDAKVAAAPVATTTHESAQVLAFTSDEEQFFDSPIDHLVVDEFAE